MYTAVYAHAVSRDYISEHVYDYCVQAGNYTPEHNSIVYTD